MKTLPSGKKLPTSPIDADLARSEAPSKLRQTAERLISQNPTQPIESLPTDQKLKLLAELEEYEKHLLNQFEKAKSADPFWYFEPTNGSLTPEASLLLSDFILPKDVPTHFDSQLDVLLSLADIRGVFGGNRSGKSTTGCIESYIQLTGMLPFSLEDLFPAAKMPVAENYPFKVRVVGEDWDNGVVGTLLPMYREMAPRDFLLEGDIDKSWFAGESTLKFRSPTSKNLQGIIEFMSNKQETGSFQGPERHKLVYDEEPKKEIREENMLRMATAHRFDEFYGMTPTKGLTWVNQEIFEKSQATFDDGLQATIGVWELATVTNPKVNLKVLRKILEKIPTYNDLLMRILGKFVSLKGKIYDSFDARVVVIPPFELNKTDFVVFRGFDPHLAKPSVMVLVACDRDENFYVVDCFREQVDTQEFKDKAAELSAPFRCAWSVCDKSANSNAKIFGDRNVYRELTTGKNFVPAMRLSEKFDGSIKAGVDFIKQLMRVNPLTGKSRFYIFNTPNNQRLIYSFKNLERAKGTNEDVTGEIDKILEGKHDEHACCRYIFQQPVHWIPPSSNLVPVYQPDSQAVGY